MALKKDINQKNKIPFILDRDHIPNHLVLSPNFCGSFFFKKTWEVPIKFMQIDGQPKITCVATSEVTTMLVTSAGRSDKYDQWQSGKVGKIHGAMRFGRG